MNYDIRKYVSILILTTNYIIIPSSKSETIGGCRIESRSDYFGISAFCKAYISNNTSFSLPPDTTTLSIFQVYNLSTTLPLATSLNLTDLLLRGNKLTTLSHVMFEGLTNLNKISLAKNSLRKLPADVFKNNLFLRTIDLSNNFFQSFETFTPSLMDLKFLTTLYLSENVVIRNISCKDTMNLKNIHYLDISSCAIENVEKDAFDNFNNLSSLLISWNPLDEIAMRNISSGWDFPNLKEFRAVGMRTMSYFSTYFLGMMKNSGIEVLELSQNRFISFPEGYYPHLKELILVGCDIKVLFPNSFSGMPNLEKLVMTRHEIQVIGKTFHKNPKLKYLDLSEYLEFSLSPDLSIEDYSFKYQINLEDLLLSSTPIKGSLHRFMLYGLYNLKVIRFYKCALESIEDNAFETLNRLTVLDLSFNKIAELTKNSFLGLKNVINLNLAGNKLSFLKPNQAFTHTPKLEVLNLNSNRIQQFPDGIFFKLYSIGMIQVNDNSLQPWTTVLVPKFENMTVLDFSKNFITFFTDQMINDMSNLEFVNFSENPINCSHCATSNLQNWMNNTNASIIGLNKSYNYMCHSPDSMKDLLLTEIDLHDLELKCAPYELNLRNILYVTFATIAVMLTIISVMWYKWKWNFKYLMFLFQLRTKKYKAEANTKEYVYDAFVSYSEKDAPWVRKHLIPAIEKSDSDMILCLPDRNFIAGETFFDNIASAVHSSRTTILILSNAYMDSNWGLFEIQMVQSKLFEDTRNGLILVFLEPILKSKLTKNLQYVIKTRTCLRWMSNSAGQKLLWERLKLAIKKPNDKGISKHIT